MRKHFFTRECLQAWLHPSAQRVTKMVLVTHIVYYGTSVISPFIAASGLLHLCTSGACFGVLLAEFILKRKE